MRCADDAAAAPMLPAKRSGSGGAVDGTPQARGSLPLFERASSRWWNPQFASPLLESQYWQCSFAQVRRRFRCGLVYVMVTCAAWAAYLAWRPGAYEAIAYQVACLVVALCIAAVLAFTYSAQYQRFYLPTSFLCTFVVCVGSLLVFGAQADALVSALATFATSMELLLLLYTVVPLPLYLCVIAALVYSILFELLSWHGAAAEYRALKLAMHLCMHLLGVHIFLLTQVRQRKTFLKVGQSLLARKDLELETQFKDHMIQSVMPRFVADELLKETTEMRRSSTAAEAPHRTSGGGSGPTVAPSLAQPSPGSGPVFRPFTMNLMKDVSILFADIAGFTKMSSNKSADELVHLLNDLFGRFDRECSRIGCEKISTLGDCYYCVSGCPEPRPDHAVCCVELGLAMIDAIRLFDEENSEEVNMRVGIHTGTVMCGIVGTKRFKFDVFSDDVSLANAMESTGMAGRVHVSDVSASFLGADYELDEATPVGERQTYFVRRRKSEQNVVQNAAESFGVRDDLRHVDSSDVETADGAALSKPRSFRKKAGYHLRSLQTSSLPVSGMRTLGGSLRARLLGSRSERSTPVGSQSVVENLELSKERPGSARKSSSLQALTSAQADMRVPTVPAAVDHGSLDTASERESSRSPGRCKEMANGSSGGKGSRSSGMADVGAENSWAALDTLQSHHAAASRRFDTDPRDFDRRLVDVVKDSELARRAASGHRGSLSPLTLRFRDPAIERKYRDHFAAATQPQEGADDAEPRDYGNSGLSVDVLVAVVVFLVASGVAFAGFGAVNVLWVVFFALGCPVALAALLWAISLLRSSSTVPLPALTLWVPRHIIGLLLIALPSGAALCNLSSVSSQLLCGQILLLVMFCHCNFTQFSSLPKTLQACAFGLVLAVLAQLCLAPCAAPFSANATQPFAAALFSRAPAYRWETLLVVALALVLIAFLNYQFEAAFRMSFFGDVQARVDRQQMQTVRDQAEWLLTNVIPTHVIDMLKVRSKYSENHEQVAVLFASIVNWADMYEETFEGGREFLRVLNEVIGDFDELLDRPGFEQVEKIKTIGSTYMAASGLNSGRRRLSVHPYEHLYQLMEFAMALQETLDNFNQNLLNFEFKMKLGYNIGPVTAGVIGTTKLYYDIWGDTVNIASRMYSTGVHGRVQLSGGVRALLQDRYEFDFRDHIDVKGIDGGMDAFLLRGRRPL